VDWPVGDFDANEHLPDLCLIDAMDFIYDCRTIVTVTSLPIGRPQNGSLAATDTSIV